LRLNKDILELHNYEVFTATSGADAFLTLSKITQPDLILLDMQMKDMSGPEFLLALEEQRPDIFNKVPVIFLTAMDKIPKSKAAGFIRKPFEFSVLIEAVHRFIEIGTSKNITE
jgi:CheY-like chemotaxis protein